MTSQDKVAVCIPTYKRPVFLHDTLVSIINRSKSDFDIVTLVADNDPQISAQPVVRKMNTVNSDIVLVSQPVRGIASVRNKLIDEATKSGAAFIAFVDDDQIVSPEWLNQLVATVRKTGADAVVGRWVPRYEHGVSSWVKRSGYWEQPERRTGAVARKFGTGNVLLRLSAVNAVPGLFDERLNLAGGSDGHFFARFHKLGFTSVWCNESVVEERILPSRSTARWIIQREFRYGTNTAYVAKTVFPSIKTYAYRSVTAAAYAGVFCLVSIVTLPFGKAVWVPNVARVARGAGLLAGLFGRMHQEYATVHGE